MNSGMNLFGWRRWVILLIQCLNFQRKRKRGSIWKTMKICIEEVTLFSWNEIATWKLLGKRKEFGLPKILYACQTSFWLILKVSESVIQIILLTTFSRVKFIKLSKWECRKGDVSVYFFTQFIKKSCRCCSCWQTEYVCDIRTVENKMENVWLLTFSWNSWQIIQSFVIKFHFNGWDGSIL